jgi:hypothetical protein
LSSSPSLSPDVRCVHTKQKNVWYIDMLTDIDPWKFEKQSYYVKDYLKSKGLEAIHICSSNMKILKIFSPISRHDIIYKTSGVIIKHLALLKQDSTFHYLTKLSIKWDLQSRTNDNTVEFFTENH